MTEQEAYFILDADSDISDDLLKSNFRWLVKLYHPDLSDEPNVSELIKVIEAYKVLLKTRKWDNNGKRY